MKRFVLALCALSGCVSAPEIVMVDRATALEQQASGSFEALERRLDRAGIEPQPEPLSEEQLSALGIRPAPLVDQSELTDADRLDGLLAQHCLGEGNDGLIANTEDACQGATDSEESAALLERANRARRQLWRFMHAQRPDVPESTLRRAWREQHVQNAACGAWLQAADGQWQAKPC